MKRLSSCVILKVTVGEKICSGSGPNKKLAKRNAAEQMLQLLGYSRPSPQPTKPAIKMAESNVMVGAGGDKKVTFVDQDQAQSQGGNLPYIFHALFCLLTIFFLLMTFSIR